MATTRTAKEHRSLGQRLTPAERIAACSCGWTEALPRKNGAWMVLKRRFREHLEAARHKCCHCGRAADFFGPEPYRSEIHNDKTSVWICDSCAKDSAADV